MRLPNLGCNSAIALLVKSVCVPIARSGYGVLAKSDFVPEPFRTFR